MKISVVSPIYKAEGIVKKLVEQCSRELEKISSDYEIILVEDCSPDGSWGEIEECTKADSRIKGIKLSRNFGQHRAITAGLDASKGEWVIVMDCDLQDDPKEIPRFYQEAQEGYDIVLGKRKFRQDGFFKKAGSYAFYNTLQYLTGIKQDREIANFGIYHRKVIDVLVKEMRESIRYFPMMVRWMGFSTSSIEVKHGAGERETAYNLKGLLHLAFNVMLTFSDKPLRLTILLGLFIIALSLLFGIWTIIGVLSGKIIVQGWASLIISIWFFGGLIVFILGMLGLYLGKTFEEVKKRPIYIIREKLNV